MNPSTSELAWFWVINARKFFSEETDCEACEDARDVPRLDNITDFHDTYASGGTPVIVTDVSPYSLKNYTVDSFFEYYRAHSQELDADLCEVSSLDESIDTIRDYYKLLIKLGPEAPGIRW